MFVSLGATVGGMSESVKAEATLPENFEVVSIAYMDGTVYVLSYNGMVYVCDEDTPGQWELYNMSEEFTEYTNERYPNVQVIVSDGERLYAIVSISVNEDDITSVEGMYLYEMSFADGAVELSNELSLDTYEMIESYDDYEYLRSIESAIIQNGMLIVSTYGSGNGMDMFAFDLNDGSYIKPFIENMQSLSGYKDDTVLVMLQDYTKNETKVQFATFDIYTEEVEVIADINMPGYNAPSGVLYYEKNDSVYYALDGELYRMSLSDTGNPVSVAGLRISRVSRKPEITDKGYYLASDYSDLSFVNIDPNARPSRQLSIVRSYTTAFETSVKQFSDARSDVEVLLRDYKDDLVQAMMSRSNDVDIYVLSISHEDFYPLLERGYMAELTDSEVISEFVNAMYPNLASIAKHDGEVVAMPFEMNNNTMAYDSIALEKLGFTQDDLPKTWLEFFDFIAEAARRCEERDDVKVFEPYYALPEIRSEIFYDIVQNYMLYMMTDANAEKAFDTPLLRALIDKYEAFDFEALGLPETYEDVDYDYEYHENGTLIMNYGEISAYKQRNSSGSMPLPLALADGMQPLVATYIECMFINPYSENRDLALEFIELVASNLDDAFITHIRPDVNEPILNEYYESALESISEYLDSLKEQAAGAPADEQEYYKTMIEEQQEYLDDYRENQMWSMTADSIAAYRDLAKYLVPRRLLNVDGEDGNYYEFFYQYIDGAIDKNTMLASIDKTVKMMLMENS